MASATVAGGGPGATGLGEGGESAFPAAFNCRVSSGTGEQRRAQPRGDVTPWHRLGVLDALGWQALQSPEAGLRVAESSHKGTFRVAPSSPGCSATSHSPGAGGREGHLRGTRGAGGLLENQKSVIALLVGS